MLLDEPARAAARDLLAVLLVSRCEQDRQLGTGTRQQATELETVIVAEAHIEQDASGGVALDGLQRGHGAPGLRDDVVAACRQQQPCGLSEGGLVIDDHDPWKGAVGRLWDRPWHG